MQPEQSIEVSISDVSITNVGFAIFLKSIENTSNRVVPIFIGPLETYSISSALDGVAPPRPNTHDLLVNLLQEMEGKILHVIINDIIGSIFYSRIVIQTEEGVFELDARPSDSVAIAIRSKCPVYMHEKVYKEASVLVGQEETEKQESSDLIYQETHEGEMDKPANELERLQKELENAIEKEFFEKAAELRDKINKIQKEN